MSEPIAAVAATQKYSTTETPRSSLFSASARLVKKLHLLAGAVVSPGDLIASMIDADEWGDNEDFVVHKDGQVWAFVSSCDEDHPFHTISLCTSLANLLPELIDHVAQMAEESAITGETTCPGGSVVGSLANSALKLHASATVLLKSSERLLNALNVTEPERREDDVAA